MLPVQTNIDEKDKHVTNSSAQEHTNFLGEAQQQLQLQNRNRRRETGNKTSNEAERRNQQSIRIISPLPSPLSPVLLPPSISLPRPLPTCPSSLPGLPNTLLPFPFAIPSKHAVFPRVVGVDYEVGSGILTKKTFHRLLDRTTRVLGRSLGVV